MLRLGGTKNMIISADNEDEDEDDEDASVQHDDQIDGDMSSYVRVKMLLRNYVIIR
jgi:hypothetical protein